VHTSKLQRQLTGIHDTCWQTSLTNQYHTYTSSPVAACPSAASSRTRFHYHTHTVPLCSASENPAHFAMRNVVYSYSSTCSNTFAAHSVSTRLSTNLLKSRTIFQLVRVTLQQRRTGSVPLADQGQRGCGQSNDRPSACSEYYWSVHWLSDSPRLEII